MGDLNTEYLKWMYRIVYNNQYSKKESYRKLISHLNSREFTYTIGLDGNRAEDGIDLRYRFGYDKRYSDALISSYLDVRPCSILEMMIALSIRCEEHIMEDSTLGDRTGKWFWNMIESLGLDRMSDERYDQDYVDRILNRFLNREYNRDGSGGLFTIKRCNRDMRTVEIWYQMCMYLDTIL